MWAAADWKGASSIGSELSEGLSQSRSWQKKRTWIGLIMARNYKRLGGIINASVGPAKARAVFADSFGILRKNVVNLRKNPVSSRESVWIFKLILTNNDNIMNHWKKSYEPNRSNRYIYFINMYEISWKVVEYSNFDQSEYVPAQINRAIDLRNGVSIHSCNSNRMLAQWWSVILRKPYSSCTSSVTMIYFGLYWMIYFDKPTSKRSDTDKLLCWV